MLSIRIIITAIVLCFANFLKAQLPNYVPTSGLISFYELDGNLNDLGPANQPFNSINTASYGQDRNSINNSSAITSRSPLVSYISNTLPANKPNSVTFAMWFRPTFTTPANQFPIIGGMRSNTTVLNSWLFFMAPGNALNFGYSTSVNGNNQNLNCNTTLTANTWYHLVATFSNADGLKVYVNGVQVASATATGNLVYNSNSNLVIGNTGAAVPSLNDQTEGLNDEVGYWDRVLSTGEIQALYTSTPPCVLSKNITGNTQYCAGNTINLTAAFTANTGQSITSYQWKKNGVNLSNGGKVSGVTTANLQVTNFALTDTGTYRVVVTTTCGVDSFQVNVKQGSDVNISNLIAYYPFNGNANDAGGNGYNATATATTNVANRFGQASNAFVFNGTTSVVEVAAPTGQTILGNGQNKSVSLWFKRGSTTSGGVLLSYQQAAPGNWNALAYIGNDGILRGWMFQGGSAPWSSGIVIDTNWHNLILVYTTSNQTAYLDGSVVANLSGTPNPGASNIIRIGNGYATTGAPGISVTGNQPFLGAIDEVRFYNKVLNTTEINELLSNPFVITTQPQSVCAVLGGSATFTIATQGAVSYQWQKNSVNISGATSATYTINNIQSNDLANYRCVVTSVCDNTVSLISGTATLSTSPAAPQPTRVYSLGTLDYSDNLLTGNHHATSINTNFNTAVPDRFNILNGALRRSSGSVILPLKNINQANATVAFWVNLNNFGAGTRAFLGGADINLPYHLMANNNQLYFQTSNGVTFVNANLPSSGWAHVAVVYQGNTNTFYLNGQQVFTTTNGINLSVNPIQSLMGLNNASSADYLADDLRVYESALTATQVEGIYGSGEEVPFFMIEPIDEHACVGGTIQFKFKHSYTGAVVTVRKNGVSLPAGGNVTITDSSVVIANASAGDFTNYTINVRKGCASVEKTVNAIQLSSTFYNTGIVRHYKLDNSLADNSGGAALSSNATGYVADRFGNVISALNKQSNQFVQMPQITSAPFTLSYWMNAYATNNTLGMVTEIGTTAVNIFKIGTGVGFDIGSQFGQPNGFKNLAVLNGSWKMITLTHDGSYCKIYVDDQLITQFRPINSSVNLRDFFPSQAVHLDDIRVYNIAMSEAEVRGLYRLPNIANTSTPQNICAGQTLNLSVTAQAMPGVNLRYQWLFNGNPISNGGNVSGANSANLQITNAQSSNQGLYSCVVIGGCTEVTSNGIGVTVGAGNVTITQQPQSQSVCPGSSATFTVATQGATVTYQWKRSGVIINGATSATYTINNVSTADTGSYTVDIIGGNCGTITSQAAVLTVLQAPTIQLAPSASICSGQSVTITAGGGGTYSWSNGLGSNASITVSPATNTTYTVTVTNASNCTATASTTVTVNANPIAAITPATVTICNGQSATLTASGGGTYAWSNSGGSNAAATFSPTSTTTYTVTVTGANNCTATASRLVTVNANPTAGISPATATICNGQSATLTASGGTSYAWSNSGGSNAQATFSPSTSTTYTVTVTDGNNCTATASRLVTVNANPTAGITPANPAICNGASQTLTASGGGTYVWSNSGGTNAAATFSPATTTTYTVTVTNTNNCTATASTTVTVNPIPNASINGPTTICSGLSATLTASGGGTYNWSNSLGTNAAITVSPTSTTTYTVTVTGTGNCTATASQTVSVQSAPTATISGNTNICNGESTTLTANGGNTYTWSNSATTASITVSPTANTSYTVTVSIGANCTATETVNVTVNQPSALTQVTETICAGSSFVFDGNSLTLPDTYNATFTNVAGCDSTVQLTLIVTPAPVTRLDTTVCDGSVFSFFNQTITQAGLYSETLQTTTGCDSIVELNVVYLSPINTTVNAQICVGQTYEFDGQQLDQADTYTATFTSAQGCDSTVTLNLSVVTTITQSITESICEGDSYTFDGQQLTIEDTYSATFLSTGGCDSVVTLNLIVNPLPQPTVTANNADLSTEQFSSYQWLLNGNEIQGADEQTYTATQNGDYSVKVTDANGCENTSDAVNVTIVSVVNYDLGFKAYPNPTSGIVNIETAINNAEINIITLEGKVLFSQKVTNKITAINLISLAHGMYIIEMKANDNISRTRIVKE